MEITYSNPLYKKTAGDASPLAQPDPYMIFDNGNFYVYATNPNGIIAYKSSKFNDFQYCGMIYSEKGRKEYWAPSVIKLDGLYYMYYSSMPADSSDTHTQNIRVAVSKSPLGPFEFKGSVLPPFSIDPHVVQNDKDELFMFYSLNDYDAVRCGTYIAVDKMKDPFSVSGAPVKAAVPTVDEEIFEKDRFEKGRHWHTVEGAFYFKEGNTHFLMYSGSAYTKESYFIGYAAAEGSESDLRRLNFKKQPKDWVYAPLLCRNEFVEGTGHNSVIKINGQNYIIYHGRSRGDINLCEDSRTFRADKLNIKGASLSVTPTITPQTIKIK